MELKEKNCETLQEKCNSNDTYIAVVHTESKTDDELTSSVKTELIPLYEKSVNADYNFNSKKISNNPLEIENSLREDLCVVQDMRLGIKATNEAQLTNQFDQMAIEHDSDISEEIFEDLLSKTNTNCEDIFLKNNDGFYECFKCKLSTKYLSYIQSHVYKHLKIKPYACLYCNFETIYFKNLQVHHQLHLEYNQPLSKLEEMNSFDFSTDRNLNDLSSIESTSTVSQFYDNIETCGNPIILNCYSCCFSTFNASSLELHIKTHCKGSETFKCSECPFETRTNSGLKIHFGRLHQQVDIDEENSKKVLEIIPNINKLQGFSCTMCPFVAATFGGLNVHKKRHTNCDFNMIANNLKYYTCNFCPQKSFSKRYIQKHTYKVHKKVNNAMKKKKKGYLSNIHSNEKNIDKMLNKNLKRPSTYSCPLCLFTGMTIKSLTSHNRKEHSDSDKIEPTPKPFPCSKCPFVAVSKGGLNIHIIKIHNSIHQVKNLKNFSKLVCCKLCPFKAFLYGSLYYHMRVVHKQLLSKSNKTKVKELANGEMIENENIDIGAISQKVNIDIGNLSPEFSIDKTLKENINTSQKDNASLLQNGNSYSCLKKNTDTSDKENVDLLQNININNIFCCSACPFVCSAKQALFEHKIHRHSEQSSDSADLCALFNCNHCVFRSNSKRSIKAHMKYHKKQKIC